MSSFCRNISCDTEASTIDKVKAGLKKAGSRCCNLMGVELPGGVFTKNADHQAQAKEAERWVGVAVALGSPSITIALTGEGTPDPYTAADNLRPVVEIAHRQRIKVLFHNDDIHRESAEILVSVIKQLGRRERERVPTLGISQPSRRPSRSVSFECWPRTHQVSVTRKMVSPISTSFTPTIFLHR